MNAVTNERAAAAPSSLSIRIEALSPRAIESALPVLVQLLQESVNEGASLGFLPPLTAPTAEDYWQSLRPQLESGARVVLAAYEHDRIVGSGQLSLPASSNGRHRAQLEKLFVSAALRGRGVGKSLLLALQDAARLHGRSLLIIYARQGDPAELIYKGMGYQQYGVIPGYSVGPAGERYDNVCLYRELPLS